MEETDRIGEPGDVVVQEKRRDHEQTGYMMNEECFLADEVSSIDDELDGDIVEVVEAGEDEKESGEVIRP